MGIEAAALSGRRAFERVQRELERRTRWWIEKLALQDYEIEVGFEHGANRAQIRGDERYKWAKVDFDVEEAVRESGSIDEIVAHELVHLVLWELTDELDRWMRRAADRGFELDDEEKQRCRAIVERTTTRLSRGMVRLLQVSR